MEIEMGIIGGAKRLSLFSTCLWNLHQSNKRQRKETQIITIIKWLNCCIKISGQHTRTVGAGNQRWRGWGEHITLIELLKLLIKRFRSFSCCDALLIRPVLFAHSASTCAFVEGTQFIYFHFCLRFGFIFIPQSSGAPPLWRSIQSLPLQKK